MVWDPLFEHVSSLVGAPPDQLKMVSAFLMSYPLASIYYRIPGSSPNIHHLFSIAVLSFFFIFLLDLGNGYIHMLADCMITYILVVSTRHPYMPWAVFGITMTHLLYFHAQRTLVGIPDGQGDITFATMVMVQKLTMFAWNVHDGRRKKEDLDESQLATRLSHVPSPLAFFGYCLFFPSVLAGPAFEYATYDALVLHKIYDQTPPGGSSTTTQNVEKRKPYGRKRVAYLHLVIGMAFMGIFAVYGAQADYGRILTPAWFTWSRATKFGFVQLAGIVARTKYYAAWSLTEGACVLTGVGFNGYDPKTGRTLWNRVRNINIVAIETSESFKVLFDSWNCRTNIWLRDCVYKRLVKKGKKPGTAQSMFTFLTSAIWHGIDGGYYIAFVTAGLLTSLGKSFRRYVQPFFLPTATSLKTAPNSLPKYPYPNLAKRVYDVLGWFFVQVNLNYVASSFMLLHAKDCIQAYNRMYWYTHILILISLVFFQAGGRRMLRKNLENRGLVAGGGDRKNLKPLNPPDVTISPPSPPHNERDHKDLRWVKHALDQRGDQGNGIGPDGGLVEDIMQGAETPRKGGSVSDSRDPSRSGSPVMWDKKVL